MTASGNDPAAGRTDGAGMDAGPLAAEPDAARLRPILMRGTVRTLALLAAAATLAGGLAGCGTPGSTTGGGTSATSPAGQPTPCHPDRSVVTRTVTEVDAGSTVCLAAGEHLEVYLHGTLAAPWSSITLEGSALSPAANGKGTLPVGVTGGFYVARTAGAARLTSSRPVCAGQSPSSAPPSPSPPSCGPAGFAVDIQVVD
jgi:hypothetical protein